MKPQTTNYKLKICGMRDRDNIVAVGSLGPEYMGFIFYPASPRYVGADFVVPEELPASVIPVGVFVNEETKVMEETALRAGINTLQLHGAEPPAQCRALKEKGYTVIKVFSVDDAFDFAVAKPYEEVVDYFLFDTKGKYYGGNAGTFNWEVLKRYDQHIPFFLSGGLTPENISDLGALGEMNLYALDMNSGVEISPGYKSVDKVKQAKRIVDFRL